MKKLISLCVCALLLAGSAGCSGTESQPVSQGVSETPSSLQTDSSLPDHSEEPSAKSVPSSDWAVTQAEIEKLILTEMEGGYTPEDPLVLVDPYRIAPLTALVIFDAPQDCTVSITIPGKTEGTTFRHDFTELRKRHEIPVYGLYAGTENPVALTLNNADGSSTEVTVPIRTEPLPDYLAPYEVTVKNHNPQDGNLLYLSMATDTVYPFAIDVEGDVRWYSTNNSFSGGIFRRMQNQRFLAFSSALYAPAFIRPGIVEMDRMGKVYTEYLHDLSHHDAIEMPNGNFMLCTIKTGSEISMGGMLYTGLDRIVELDRTTGEEIRAWDLNELFGYTPEDIANGKYLHCNAVQYIEPEDAILVSVASVNCVIKFSAETGEILWVIADPRNQYPEPIQSKILAPTGEGFEWQGMQHAVLVTPEGYIMMFDNGSGRWGADDQILSDQDSYSRLVIYDVDEQNQTIRQVYQYGKERGNELFATYLGDVDYLAPDHYLLNAGGRIVNEEGIAAGSAVDVYMGINRAEAKIVEILNNEVVFEMHVGSEQPRSFNNIYRVEWDNLYQEGDKEYDLKNTQAVRFGTLQPSAAVEFALPETYEELTEISTQAIDYGYQLNVPVVVKDFEQGDTLLMELKNGENATYYPAAGMGGAQGIVRKSGLDAGNYSIGFVLQKADGTVRYCQTGSVWAVQ